MSRPFYVDITGGYNKLRPNQFESRAGSRVRRCEFYCTVNVTHATRKIKIRLEINVLTGVLGKYSLMVVLNIKMEKQGLRANGESESGLPCDIMFGRLYSFFFCMRCAVLRASILYSDTQFV